MNGRDQRYGRSRKASLKAKVGIATAVLVGGGAIGVAAVAATSHGGATTASSAGYRYSAPSSESLLVSGMSTSNWGSSYSDFSRMTNVRNFSQWWYHRQMFAVQRGVVVLVTKRFVILESKNGSLHLWYLSGHTRFQNVSSTYSGTNALLASSSASSAAMAGTMTTAVTAVTNVTTVQQLLTPVTTTKVLTVQVVGTGVTVQVAVTQTTAEVITKTTTTRTVVVQNAFTQMQTLRRGDVALIVGFRQWDALHAQKILFMPISSSDMGMGSSTSTGSSVPSGSSGTHT
jgi:hypothetical protein